MLSWDAQLEVVKKEIAELENRISVLSEELQAAQGTTDSARVQRILAVREQHLKRAKIHARFIEHKIAQGCREPKPFPYTELASICFGRGGKKDSEGRNRGYAEGSRVKLCRQRIRIAHRQQRTSRRRPCASRTRPKLVT